MKILQYRIIASEVRGDFERTINHWIYEGWQPYGDFKFIEGRFLQSMVKMNCSLEDSTQKLAEVFTTKLTEPQSVKGEIRNG